MASGTETGKMKGDIGKMHTKIVTGVILKCITGIAGVLIMFVVFGCSTKQDNTPEDFLRMFLQKHIPLIDVSTADFYVKDEQSGIKDVISRNIQAKKEEGTYDSLKNATYDLSSIRVTVLDRNITYIDDEPKTLVELKATGFYTMTIDGQEKTDLEEEIFVLQAVGGEWKVTEKVKPWKSI
jgi:hypothetical protein